MNMHPAKSVNRRNRSLCIKEVAPEIVTLEECRKLVCCAPLSDERILAIRNGVIGIVNTVFNTYLEKFEQHGS